MRDADAIVTHVEVCGRHGVGRLVERLFAGESNILSIRSANLYDGRQEFAGGGLCLAHEDQSAAAVLRRVRDAVGPSTVKRILCIPYFADDVRTALALQEIFGVPLCTYIMDDQNVCADGIPDALMRQLLEKSQLRLAISPELSSVYSAKYGCRMWYMPPLAPSGWIPSRVVGPDSEADARHGIIIGNIWGSRWVELLRHTVRDSGVMLTWHCSGEFRWLPCSKEDLVADSISPRDPLPEDALIRTLRETRFAVVPTGDLDNSDDRRFIAQLSLPSRIPYMMAVSHIPIVVLGSRATGAAHFVEQFGIGVVAGYERKEFLDAVDYITGPDVNREMRRNAFALAHRFADAGAAEWIWQSTARGEPVDRRYEDLMPLKSPDLSGCIRESKRDQPSGPACPSVGPTGFVQATAARADGPQERDTVLLRNAQLRIGLKTLMASLSGERLKLDVVVTSNEINDRHGTGPIIKRILAGRKNILSIRSRDDWGAHDFGDRSVTMPQAGKSREEGFFDVVTLLAGLQVRSVLCVPCLPDELLTSIAIRDAFGARLCGYIMDDQNAAADLISDDLMREFLEKCSLRLTTHPELRLAYERKYGLPFYLLPAVVPDHLVAREPIEPAFDPGIKQGALIGSFWDQLWFDRLCSTLAPSGYRIDWYGNNQSPWVKFPPHQMAEAGITSHGIVPEERLAVLLRKYPFVIVPVGTLESEETNTGVASLSLPGRILFAAASSHIPILIVGSRRTCGAHFVRHFDIGENVPYDAGELAAAMMRLSDPVTQARMRRNAAAIAPAFSDRGVVDWLASSIELGRITDTRFEDVFAGYLDETSASQREPGKEPWTSAET